MIDVSDSIKVYLRVCKNKKRLNEKTLKAYQCDLDQFTKWLEASDQEFDRESVSSYLEHLNKRYAPSSAKRKIASIKAFASYREIEGICDNNPFRTLRISIKEPKRLPKTIPLSKMNAIFKRAYQPYIASSKIGDGYIVARNRALLELLIATGLRVSELCKLDHVDLDISGRLLRIMGKGSKERVIQLESLDTLGALEAYLHAKQTWVEFRTSENLPFDCSALFCNRFGTRLGEQAVRAVVHQYAKEAGVEERVTPHMFRHTFATILLEKDVDVRYIQQMLGHSSITTTEIYTHVASSKLRTILKTNNPRDEIVI